MPGPVEFTTDAARVAADLGAWALKTQARVERVVATHGFLLQTAVKRHAMGRPGPKMVIGHYNASIGLQLASEGGTAYAAVGTNAAQGRRLELGFRGADALGRHYNQPPYPHFGPGLDEVKPLFEAAMTELGIPPA